MNLLEIGCSCLAIADLKAFMNFVGYPGKGIVATMLAVAIWAYGYYRGDYKAKQLAYAMLISLAMVGILTTVLKYSLQLPRPNLASGYTFPSGDSATAFAVATAAGTAYPAAAPMLHLLALLTALSRLYFRAHYVWDVIGGALLGSACSYWWARKLISRPPRRRRSSAWMFAWTPGAILALAGLSFFWLIEQEIARYKIAVSGAPVPTSQLVRVDFGSNSARPHLLAGWSPNRVWSADKIPINWVEGLRASIGLTLLQPRDARLIVRAYPYRAQGFLCQRAQVTINGVLAGKFLLEQGWHNYQLRVPQNLLRVPDNRIDFTFAYTNDDDWHGVNPERKPLSVAFQTLYLSSD